MLLLWFELNSFESAFGKGLNNRNYYIDLIKEFSPNSSKNNASKCDEIPGFGFPIQSIPQFYAYLERLFDVGQQNIYLRMFFFDYEIVSKNRLYKYGLEVRTFHERTYVAVVLTISGSNSSSLLDETFFVTKNPQLLPTVLKTSSIDLGNFLGCGNLKLLFKQSSGESFPQVF